MNNKEYKTVTILSFMNKESTEERLYFSKYREFLSEEREGLEDFADRVKPVLSLLI